MALAEEIGAKIKYYRKKRGLKIAELAEMLHKTGATVSKYESGQIAIDVVTLYEIAGQSRADRGGAGRTAGEAAVLRPHAHRGTGGRQHTRLFSRRRPTVYVLLRRA